MVSMWKTFGERIGKKESGCKKQDSRVRRKGQAINVKNQGKNKYPFG
jgi:hypothetical protein